MYLNRYDEFECREYQAAETTVYSLIGVLLTPIVVSGIIGLVSLIDSCNADLEAKIKNGNIESVKSEENKGNSE